MCGQHTTQQMLTTRDVNIERAHTASFAAVLNRLALPEAANSALQVRVTTLEGISTSSSAPLSDLAQQHHHQPPSPPLHHPATPLPEFRPLPSPNPSPCTLPLHPSLPTSWLGLIPSPVSMPLCCYQINKVVWALPSPRTPVPAPIHPRLLLAASVWRSHRVTTLVHLRHSPQLTQTRRHPPLLRMYSRLVLVQTSMKVGRANPAQKDTM